MFYTTSSRPQTFYKNISLSFFLQGFATLIREWPGDLYNNKTIVKALKGHLNKDPNNRILLEALAEL